MRIYIHTYIKCARTLRLGGEIFRGALQEDPAGVKRWAGGGGGGGGGRGNPLKLPSQTRSPLRIIATWYTLCESRTVASDGRTTTCLAMQKRFCRSPRSEKPLNMKQRCGVVSVSSMLA